MALPLDPSAQEALVERIRFYRELGLAEFYRRNVEPAAGLVQADEADGSSVPMREGAPAAQQEARETPAAQHANFFGEESAISARKRTPAPTQIAEAIPAAQRAAALEILREEIGECTRCPLHKGRNKLVFADGDPNARLMFVGEGPGADEDAQGLPFVGKAGQLLNNMIAAMGLKLPAKG